MDLKFKKITPIIILQTAFGIVFIFSGITKLNDIPTFAKALVNFNLLTNSLIEIIKYIVPIFEIILGIGIIFNFNSSLPTFIASLMLSFFTALIVAKIFEGEEISCGCFGALSGNKLDEYSIIRNILLIAVAIIIATYFENKKFQLNENKFKTSKHKALNIIFISNLIFFLASQSFIFALQNHGLKSRLALLVNDYDILKEGDNVQPFEANTLNNEVIKIDNTEINEQLLIFILKPGCSPCKANLPYWNFIFQQISKKIKIISISIAELESTKKYVAENKISFPVYSNNTDDFLLNYKAFLTPQTILVNSNGKVIKNWKGILTENVISEIIKSIK